MTTETVRAVNVGTTADDGTGARLRDAAQIWNSNDALLAQLVAGILAGIDPDRNSLKKLADLIAGLSASLASTSAALAGKATPADVAAAVNAILGGAGPAYDTLKELQDLLTADETAAAALAALVATKAPLASPAFTGAPTAPTPAAGDNSTRIATTAFLAAAMAAAGSGVSASQAIALSAFGGNTLGY